MVARGWNNYIQLYNEGSIWMLYRGVKRCFHPKRDGVSLRPECQFSRSRPSWCWKILNLKFMAHPQRRSIKTPRFEIYNYSFFISLQRHMCARSFKIKTENTKTLLDNTCWNFDLLGKKCSIEFYRTLIFANKSVDEICSQKDWWWF